MKLIRTDDGDYLNTEHITEFMMRDYDGRWRARLIGGPRLFLLPKSFDPEAINIRKGAGHDLER